MADQLRFGDPAAEFQFMPASHPPSTVRSMPVIPEALLDSKSQFLIADSAKRHGRQALFFESDVADESFHEDEKLKTRLEAMIETMDARRRAA